VIEISRLVTGPHRTRRIADSGSTSTVRVRPVRITMLGPGTRLPPGPAPHAPTNTAHAGGPTPWTTSPNRKRLRSPASIEPDDVTVMISAKSRTPMDLKLRLSL